MGKTFRRNRDDYSGTRQKFTDRRQKRLRVISYKHARLEEIKENPDANIHPEKQKDS